MNPRGRSVDDDLVNLGLILIAAVGLLVGVLRLAGSAAAWLSGAQQPTGGWEAGFRVLSRPGDPGSALGARGLTAWAYWLVLAVMIAAVAASAITLWRRLGSLKHKTSHDPAVSSASQPDVMCELSPHRRRSRARSDPPSVSGATEAVRRRVPAWPVPRPGNLGVRRGLHPAARTAAIWQGPSRRHQRDPRRSRLRHHDRHPTRQHRRHHHRPTATRTRRGLRSTTPGRRAAGGAPLVPRPRMRGPTHRDDPRHRPGLRHRPLDWGRRVRGFWEGKTRTALQALLHAAALDARNPSELFAWTLSPSATADAVAILSSHSKAAPGWADSLESMIHADPRTRDSIWMGVSLALSCLADPRVLDAVSPGPGEHFDPVDFLTNNGTLYLLATGAGAGASWSLVAAFIEDLAETARRLAAASPGARLDPPLLLALDEIGNLSPLPSLPTLMAEGGGTGITTMPVLQSLSQARNKWGDHAAGAIWDASIVKIILGGTSSARDLQDLSALIGERDERTDTLSVGEYGSRSLQRSMRRVPVMAPECIRTLSFGTALILLRSAPPLVTDLMPWVARKDSLSIRNQRTVVEQQLRPR